MFNLPDYRGRFLRGVEDPDGVGGVPAPVPARDPDAAGRSGMAAGGSSAGAVGSVQEDELKRHDHNISGDVHSALPAGNEFIGIAAPAGNRPDGGQTYPDKYQNSISSVGGSETRPKNACVNFLIKL